MKNNVMVDTFPDVVRIEPSGTCNFRCQHCCTGCRPNHRGILDRKGYATILSQLVDANLIPRVMVFYHGGEPLLNMHLDFFVRSAKVLGVEKTVLTTNASLLTESRSRDLIVAHLDELKISFDGNSAKENNLIRRGANFTADADKVRLLLDMKREMHVNHPKIRITNTRICGELDIHHPSEPLEIPDYLKEFFSGYIDEINIESYPAIVWSGYRVPHWFRVHCFNRLSPSYCEQLFETFTILADGNVVPCCLDINGDVILGNVFQESMLDIWNGDRYSSLRHGFQQRQYNPFCSRCREVAPSTLVRLTECRKPV